MTDTWLILLAVTAAQLHVSGIWGKVEPLQMLIDAGAKVNVQATGAKSLGLAPLHWYTHPGYGE